MSDVKDMIGESINRIFSQRIDRRVMDAAESGEWPKGLWDVIDESGFADVLVADVVEEADGKWADAYPVFHAIGFHRAPLPLSETIIANALLRQAGLPSSAGPTSILQQQPGDRFCLQLADGRLLLNGTAAAVPWARASRAIVVAGRIGDDQIIGLIDTNSPGVAIEAGVNVAREPRDQVIFNAGACRAFAICDRSLPDAPVMLYGALARAAMLGGAAESVLRESVQYANDRIQFGRPIGKFQAIQQSLAVLAGEVVSAQTVTLAAHEAATTGPSPFNVAVAKIRAGQAAGVAANIAHQVHGAIGFTYEHSLHYATRRLWSWRAEFGAEAVWAERLGKDAIRRRGANFWADLTQRGRHHDC